MKFSFKKFVELVDQEEDLTEQQLDEIFGIFSTHDEKQKKLQAQKKAEFDERRKALQAKQKVNPKAGAKDEFDDNDPRKVPKITPKPSSARQTAAQGRAAEVDWVNNIGEAEEADKEFVVTTGNGFRDSEQTVKAKSKEDAKKKVEDKIGYGHYVKAVKLKEDAQLQEMGDKKVGQKVKCIFTQRAGKAYSKFGTPAKDGDTGKVTKINELKDVTIVQFKTDDGREVYCHIQNLA